MKTDLDTKKITVIMPVYNQEMYITEAIHSILTQTHQNFELIIINDGSSDKTLDRIKSIIDNRITIITYSINKGKNHALNKGYEKAKGEFVTFFAGDDVMFSHSLEKKIKYAKKHRYVFGNSIETNKNLEPRKPIFSKNMDRLFTWKKEYKNIIFSNFVPGGNFLIKKTIMDEIMPLPESLSFEDWWVSYWGLKYNECVYYISEPLSYYRIHDNNDHGKSSNLPFDKYYKSDISRHFTFYLELLKRYNSSTELSALEIKLIKLILLNYDIKLKVINQYFILPNFKLIINYGFFRYLKLNIISKNIISLYYSTIRRS